jgi:hypothetical protein
MINFIQIVQNSPTIPYPDKPLTQLDRYQEHMSMRGVNLY